MIGANIGDIVESRFEFNNYKNKEFELFTEDCCVTDDSIMTLAIAKTLMETEKQSEVLQSYLHPNGIANSLFKNYTIKCKLIII